MRYSLILTAFIVLILSSYSSLVYATTDKPYEYKKVKRYLNGKPAIVNIFTINPKKYDVEILPSYGSFFINEMKIVRQIARQENAIAAINASYFKPDTGVPLGVSIINKKVITGPLYDRVVLGITDDNEFKMAKMKLKGKIFIGRDVELELFNINQPIFSKKAFSIYTPEWGYSTPKTSEEYIHIIVDNYKIQYSDKVCTAIPSNGFVIVGPKRYLPKKIEAGEFAFYETHLSPDDWFDVKHAVGGGPYLVKDGKKFIDRQKFNDKFLWRKEPRTAVGYTKAGTLMFVTVDGRKRRSQGATLTELAQIMYDLGAYNAMNLDGGSSTQMIINGKLVNNPTVRGGGRVTNALVVKYK